MDSLKTNTKFEVISNKLFDLKKQQKALGETEKELKAEVLSMMKNTNLHKGTNGSIEKITRKPKRIYDSDKLRVALLKHGMPEEAVEIIITESTRHMNVDKHLSVKVRRPK